MVKVVSGFPNTLRPRRQCIGFALMHLPCYAPLIAGNSERPELEGKTFVVWK